MIGAEFMYCQEKKINLKYRMLSDTHFHLFLMEEQGTDVVDFFKQLVDKNFRFGLEIGTICDDLPKRLQSYNLALSKLSSDMAEKVKKIMHFSAGIWPSPEAIQGRESHLAELEHCVLSNKDKIVAIGECGLDRHYNKTDIDAEFQLFESQMDLAKKLNLPVIIHSREDSEGTIDVIKNNGYNNGVIHCYSYGKAEAEKFLDLGWYISFSGSCTYAKKSKIEDMRNLIRYIPADRILLETDAPYLAPVPKRGERNTPFFVDYVYDFVSDVRCVSKQDLANCVFENAIRLFKS